MHIPNTKKQHNPFHGLSPETIITLVEAALKTVCSNLCRPLNSYVNRVYELATRDGSPIIAKFYRPGRWTKKALQDEHDFLHDLAENEIPVVAPLLLENGKTIGEYGDIRFALFQKKGGRSFDEYSEEQWLELGRLLGRTHSVGAKRRPQERITMSPEKSTRQQLQYIIGGNFIPPGQKERFSEISYALIDTIIPFFQGTEMIRIHGDCHFSNIIYRPGESFYIIDFDDMATGPPVQDLWMLLPGHLKESYTEIDLFLEGYETFRNFDRRTLRLIEPLRAMRYIHYIAWCAYQVVEDGASRAAEDFGSWDYWERETADLAEQLERIRKLPSKEQFFF